MKRDDACLPCVLDDLKGALDLLDLDPVRRREIEEEAGRFLRETFPRELEPSYYITGVHRILKRIAGLAVPFRELREGCNRVGVEIAASLEEELRDRPEEERFRLLCLWAVAGNHLDFRTVGTGYGFGTEEIRGMLQEKVALGFAVDETDSIRRLLYEAERVLYVPDNVGEIALDRLLVRWLRERRKHVTVPYRGGAITSDAMLADFRAVGLDREADSVLQAGPDTLGVSFAEMTPEMRAALEAADVVVTKGQANFYVFHEHMNEVPGAICCLLTTKCGIVSREFDRDGKVNVAAVISRGRPR